MFFEIMMLISIFVAIGTFQIIEMLWITFFSMVFLICVIEAITSSLMFKIVPVYFSVCCIDSYYVISVTSALGRIFAGGMIYACCLVWVKGMHIALVVLAIIKIISVILFLLNYKNLKIKAIAKLIKLRKELRE